MKTEHLITFAIVVVAVIAAAFISKKLGLNSYEEYSNYDSYEDQIGEYKAAA